MLPINWMQCYTKMSLIGKLFRHRSQNPEPGRGNEQGECTLLIMENGNGRLVIQSFKTDNYVASIGKVTALHDCKSLMLQLKSQKRGDWKRTGSGLLPIGLE